MKVINGILRIVKCCGFIMIIILSCFKTYCSANENKGEFHPVETNQIPEVLNMISNKVLSNYGRIKTWQGKTEVISDYLYEGANAEQTFKDNINEQGKIPKILKKRGCLAREFVLDTENDLLYVKTFSEKPIEYADLEDGRNFRTVLPSSGISIMTPKYYTYTRADTMRNGVVINQTALKEFRNKCSTCGEPQIFDPRQELESSLKITQRSFPRIIKEIREPKENKMDGLQKIEERIKDGIIEYRITISGRLTLNSNDPNRLFISSVFSSDKGFNMVYQETTLHNPKGERLVQKHIWDYDLIDGIYVLARTNVQNYSWDTGNLTYEDTEIYSNAKINKPISSEIFNYKNLGLKNGDKFIDKIEGKEYKYKDANLVFVADVNK